MSLVNLFPHKTQHRLRRLSFYSRHPGQFRKFRKMRNDGSNIAIRYFMEKECIFVHIPKCAGNAIEESLFGHTFGGHLTIWWYQMVFLPEEFERFFKFTVVRNPWDRLVSAFFFMKRGGMNEFDRSWAEQNLAEYDDFHSFVENWVTKDNVESWIHFQPQVSFICLGGNLVVDFVGRLECLEEDFAYICKKLGMDRSLLNVNVGSKDKKDFREYYTDETRRIVGEVYQDDIETFGYQFC